MCDALRVQRSVAITAGAAAHDLVNDRDLLCLSPHGTLSGVLTAAVSPSHMAALPAAARRDGEGAKLRDLGTALTSDPVLSGSLPLMLLPSVRTAADTRLTDVIGGVVAGLVGKDYAGHQHGHSFVMVGPRGGGRAPRFGAWR